MVEAITCGEVARTCRCWQDHEWSTGRLVETGRHPLLGAFQKFLARCLNCGQETTETRWLDLSRALRGTKLDKEE